MCKKVYDEFKDSKKFERIDVWEKLEDFRHLSQNYFNLKKKSEKIIKFNFN
jgi:flagellar motility protein MotE (MotC chaperone)